LNDAPPGVSFPVISIGVPSIVPQVISGVPIRDGLGEGVADTNPYASSVVDSGVLEPPLRSRHGVKMPRWASSMEGGNFKVDTDISLSLNRVLPCDIALGAPRASSLRSEVDLPSG